MIHIWWLDCFWMWMNWWFDRGRCVSTFTVGAAAERCGEGSLVALRAGSGKPVEVTLSELVLALRMRCRSEHTSELHGRPATARDTRDDPQLTLRFGWFLFHLYRTTRGVRLQGGLGLQPAVRPCHERLIFQRKWVKPGTALCVCMVTKKKKTWLQLVIGRQISGHKKKDSCGKMNNNIPFLQM